MSNEGLVSVINKRGRVIWLPQREVPKAIKDQGMRIFPNPKQTYYSEYDQSYPSPNAPQIQNLEGTTEGDILDVEVLT